MKSLNSQLLPEHFTLAYHIRLDFTQVELNDNNLSNAKSNIRTQTNQNSSLLITVAK